MLAGMQVLFTALQVLLTPALPIPRDSHLNCQSDVSGANGAMPSDHDLFLWLNLLKRDQNFESKDLDGPKHPKQRQAGSNTTESTYAGREVANSLAIIHTLDQAGSDRKAQGGAREEGSFRNSSQSF
ncbi:hypothetical protein Nmel_013216 [Mimus melanotis]